MHAHVNLLVLITLLTACGKNTLEFGDTGEGLNCGPGTHEESGVCVPDADAGETDADADADADSDADTDNGLAPSAPEVMVSPYNATQLSNLRCKVVTDAVDPQGDEIRYTYTWSVDGVLTDITDETVPDSATQRGETWSCTATPSDGTNVGASGEASLELGLGFSAIAMGVYHQCGLTPENLGEMGEATCWGNNTEGESSPPSGTFANIFAGNFETCAIDAAGALTCWGTVSWGMDSPPAGSFVSAALGYYAGYAIGSDGRIDAWGSSDAPPTGSVTALAAGEYDACALSTGGALSCWGNNGNGECDAPTGTFTTVSGSYHNFCALDADGFPACWGLWPAVNAAPTEALTALSVASDDACGLRADGSLLCWGAEATLASDAPTGTFVQVAVGTKKACAVDTSGRVTCWGPWAEAAPTR